MSRFAFNAVCGLLVAASFFVLATEATAQYAGGAAGSDLWYRPTYSSTYEEGVQRGYADIVRSQGMANLMNSQAAKEYEEARRSYLDNRLKATQTYFEMRRVNQEARAREKTSPLSYEQYVRIARQEAPDALGISQLDPLTGAIRWPLPLRKAEYDAHRLQLEKLFQERSVGYVQAGAIEVACEKFANQLKTDLMKFTPNDYLVAKKFLDSLAYASRALRG